MLFPIAYWGIAVIGINYLTTFLLSVSKYVKKLILFIVLGHIFYIAEETLSSKEAN
jgi:hypothetical protein